MADAFDFISASDRPALLAISTPEWQSMAEAALTEMGFKVQKIEGHSEFAGRFNQIQYEVLIVEEIFGGSLPTENLTLQTIQRMPMAQRRHAAVFLLSDAYETLNSLQAFQQSVHAVINYSEMALLGQIIQKIVADNTLFYSSYRQMQQRILQGKQ